MRIAASTALNDETITQSVTYVGIELLGQLKIPSEMEVAPPHNSLNS